MSETKVKSELSIQGILDRDHPVGSVYISEISTSPASLFGGSWERIYSRFLWAGAEWKTISTSESDTNTYTFTETTHARFGDPVSNQWVYADLPAGSYTRTQAFNIANNVDPAYGFVKVWQVIDPSGTPEAGTTFGETVHTLTIDEMPRHTHTFQAGWGEQSGGTVVGIGQYMAHLYDWPSEDRRDYKGLSVPHNNMPPALAVYMWSRVA